MASRPYNDLPLVDVYDLTMSSDPATKKDAEEELALLEKEKQDEIARQKAARKARKKAEEDYYYEGGRGRRSRKLRLDVKRRGTKRHGRSGKHSKLRKLSTRRR